MSTEYLRARHRRAPFISVMAVSGLLALAACGSPSTTGTDPGATPAYNTEATLRISTGGTPQTMDPVLQKTTGEQPYTFLIYDRLTQISNDYKVEPMLATSWDFAADGGSLVFHLRTDVTFHDGTAFDADAVKANVERAKSLPGSTVAATFASVSSVEVVDKQTVTFVLKSGGAELPALMASNAGEMVSPKAISSGKDLALNPGDSGSGPYVLTSLKPNEGATYERAPGDYWNTAVHRVKAVTIAYIAASSGRLNGVRAGQLDLAQVTGTDVAPAQALVDAKQIGGDGAWQLSQMGLMFRATHPNLADVRVRQALSYAIDKASIAKDLYAGNCTATNQNFPEGHWAYNPSVASQYTYDPAKAKSLLAEAGASALTFTMVYASGSTFESLAQVVQAQLAKVGVTVTLNAQPQANAVADFRGGKFDSAMMAVVGAADPSQIYTSFYLGGYKLAVDTDGSLAAALGAANSATLTAAARSTAYQDLAKKIADNAWNVPICYSKQLWVHSDKVVGVDKMRWIWAGIPDFGAVSVTT